MVRQAGTKFRNRQVSKAGGLEKGEEQKEYGKNTLVDLHFRTMTQHTFRLCKGYLTKSDGVLRQMTWPPQSPDLDPIKMVWDELDCRVKGKQPTSAQHMWELIQNCWKSIPGEAG
uniref:Uncharacterized protein n=1 Tax=Oncorhynchus tshawytscha TaxID=74940 RepID=A0AAZ3Q2S8_ONCTS